MWISLPVVKVSLVEVKIPGGTALDGVTLGLSSRDRPRLYNELIFQLFPWHYEGTLGQSEDQRSFGCAEDLRSARAIAQEIAALQRESTVDEVLDWGHKRAKSLLEEPTVVLLTQRGADALAGASTLDATQLHELNNAVWRERYPHHFEP